MLETPLDEKTPEGAEPPRVYPDDSSLRGKGLVNGQFAAKCFVLEVKRSYARDSRKKHCGNQQYE